MKLFYQCMAIFFNFSPPSSQLYPLLVENCDSNSRLVVDEDENVKSGLKRLRSAISTISSLNLPLSSSSTTSRELLSQFYTCSE